MQTTSSDSAAALLASVYQDLGFQESTLLSALEQPPSSTREDDEWLEKGEWLRLACRVGADKVFFVENDPVAVFHAFPAATDEQVILDCYRRTWCMARPSILFVAIPGDLRVYSLNRPPARNRDEWEKIEPLAVVQRSAEVAEALSAFHREQIELGTLPADDRFGRVENRADRQLIEDLKQVRKALLQSLDQKYVHALIGRAIFIRYLEDRGILERPYFTQIAQAESKWEALLNEDLERPPAGAHHRGSYLYRILKDKKFTYALFRKLAVDFNGDMFPQDSVEELQVNQGHLDLLRRFLLGDIEPSQPALFFWAYDFSIVPIDLISSIYEEFYHQQNVEDDKGTHYTPAALVENILSRVLTSKVLSSKPRVLDQACGSGIFLVEAFRRIVRFEAQQRGRALNAHELREILGTQLVGIEINHEAVRIAAFSLYLALLNYQEPPSIIQSPRLPHLINREGVDHEESYPVLFQANAFTLTPRERKSLEDRLKEKPRFKGRAAVERLLERSTTLELDVESFDVVVGNPPWGEASERQEHDDQSEVAAVAVLWARVYGRPVGDRSYSQLFIHRALSFVKEGGHVGLLVHASTLFNRRPGSQSFRRFWLRKASLLELINFSHVRTIYFEKSIAPFVFVHYCSCPDPDADNRFIYWSARYTAESQSLRSVVLALPDRRLIRQGDIQERDYLWKTYWWGSHRDASLMAGLDLEPSLSESLPQGTEAEPAYGFQLGPDKPREPLRSLWCLGTTGVTRYGPLRQEWFEPPPRGVKRQPDERLYRGLRLLVVRGVKGTRGVGARLEKAAFSFRHTMYCVPLTSFPEWKAKVLLGIFWSALGSYRIFMRAGSWGAWFDQIEADDVLSMPVRFLDRTSARTKRILEAVNTLRDLEAAGPLFASSMAASCAEMEAELDEAVFDLYDLAESQRDLIRDFLQNHLDLLNNKASSQALRRLDVYLDGDHGTVEEVQGAPGGLEAYLEAFLDIWNRELEPGGEFAWRRIVPSHIPMLAVVFSTQPKAYYSKFSEPTSPSTAERWRFALAKCSQALQYPVGRRLFIDGMVRAVSDTDVIIVKRNEKRLWSRSMAREDAEATLLQALFLQSASR
jgi:N-6 DNA Methylase/Eco57I restriction-modification methylase